MHAHASQAYCVSVVLRNSVKVCADLGARNTLLFAPLDDSFGFQMVWFTGKRNQMSAKQTTIPGGAHITARAQLTSKSPPTLCWRTRSTRTLVLDCPSRAGYPNRGTLWVATLQHRYAGSVQMCLRLFRRLSLVACFSRLPSGRCFPPLPLVTSLQWRLPLVVFSRACHREHVFPY